MSEISKEKSKVNKTLQFIKKYNFIIFIIVFSLIKNLLVTQLPIVALPEQSYDDNLMFQMAQNIREGHWLGQYNSNTLVKGAFFPLLLATINYLRIIILISNGSYIYIRLYIFYILNKKII